MACIVFSSNRLSHINVNFLYSFTCSENLFIYLCLCIYVCMYAWSVNLYIHLSMYLSFYLPTYLSSATYAIQHNMAFNDVSKKKLMIQIILFWHSFWSYPRTIEYFFCSQGNIQIIETSMSWIKSMCQRGKISWVKVKSIIMFLFSSCWEYWYSKFPVL